MGCFRGGLIHRYLSERFGLMSDSNNHNSEVKTYGSVLDVHTPNTTTTTTTISGNTNESDRLLDDSPAAGGGIAIAIGSSRRRKAVLSW